MPGSADWDLAGSPPTAKTLSVRAVFPEPHSGHFTGSLLDMDLIRRSNLALQDVQAYSYIGIGSKSSGE
jgi:hypothetical protein